jgi:uncharacterized protein YbjT (DUF2867 family)
MNVAVAGGTGFIGKVVLKKLVEAGHHVVALIRQGSLLKIASFRGTESRYVYYDTPSQVAAALEGCQAVINLVGIIREGKDESFDYAHHLIPLNLVRAATNIGIRRFIQMSALGVDRGMDTEYLETKKRGENAVKNSNLDWTIFRPSVVYGPGDGFVSLLMRLIRRLPLVPVIGDGKYRLQPVWVDNVTEGFVKCLTMPATYGKTYDVGGLDKFSYNDLLDIVGTALGRKRIRKIHLSVPLMKMQARIFGRFGFFPFTIDMLTMLLAENVTDDNSFFSDLKIEPARFADKIREYLK